MIDLGHARELIETYAKHGWMLRRVLLSEQARKQLKDGSAVFGGAAVVPSTVDAVWFSRPPKAGPVSWELRYLGDIPFALLAKVDEASADMEDELRDVEERLAAAIVAKRSA